MSKEALIDLGPPKKQKHTEIEVCSRCGSSDWILDKSHFDLHGYGIYCTKCKLFLRWTGKGKVRESPNAEHKARHKIENNGELICDFCGRTESEVKLFGGHFAIDHRLAKDFGGEDVFENTRPMCARCHYIKTSLEHDTRGLRKFIKKNDDLI